MNVQNKHSYSIRLIARWSAVLLLAAQTPLAAESVNWQGPAGSRIKQIRYYPKETTQRLAAAPAQTAAVVSNVIDSPPVDGFVPWIVVTPTNWHLDAETTGIYDAFPDEYGGLPPAGTSPRTDYFIAIFDTGASAHVIGYANALGAGLYNSTYLTEDNYVEVTGVTGSVDAHVTQPYALFIAGLDALEPNAPGQSEMVLPTTAGMAGEYNVATLIGQNPGSNPDLATAIGAPMSIFYDTHIEVAQPITVIHDGTEYTSPRITFYEKGSTDPNYPNYIPLELKPAGSTNVQYITYGFDPEDLLDMFSDPFGFELDYSPITPSVIIGTSSQSLFFIHGVDLTENSHSAQDKNRFMLDTGAQITVIGSRIAARLKLNPANKDFVVEIQGVDGRSIEAPGFYLDSLTIPAMGQWLEFTTVPVVLLDIFSPEGGSLDGIIGMNLFTQYNLILRAGGFMLDNDPRLEFQRIQTSPQAGDIAPEPLDGKVDLLDMSAMSAAWLSNNAAADIAPSNSPDGIVNIQDLTLLAENWLAGVNF
jgi:hypothetical protein